MGLAISRQYFILFYFIFLIWWCIINKYEWSFEFGVMSCSFYFDGFGFVFWESNKGEGEMRKEKMVGNGFQWVSLTEGFDHFTGMGSIKK